MTLVGSCFFLVYYKFIFEVKFGTLFVKFSKIPRVLELQKVGISKISYKLKEFTSWPLIFKTRLLELWTAMVLLL